MRCLSPFANWIAGHRLSPWVLQGLGIMLTVLGIASLYADRFAGGAPYRYVNDLYRVSVGADNELTLTSSDGRIRKTVTLEGNSLEVRYQVDPALGTLTTRLGLSPDASSLLVRGQRDLSTADRETGWEITNRAPGRSTTVRIVYLDDEHGGAHFNPRPDDGTPNSPRDQALTHVVELSGAGSFNFAFQSEVE